MIIDFDKETRDKLSHIINNEYRKTIDPKTGLRSHEDDFENFLQQNEILIIGLNDIEEAWNKHPDKVLVMACGVVFLIPKDTALILLTLVI